MTKTTLRGHALSVAVLILLGSASYGCELISSVDRSRIDDDQGMEDMGDGTVDMGAPRDAGPGVDVGRPDSGAEDAGATDTGVADGGVDASQDSGVADAGPDAGCTMSASQCGASCVDVQTDPTNCGFCDTTCVNGRTCSGAVCGCNYPASTACPSGCADLTNDPANCGNCGNACGGGAVCSNGSCVPACDGLSGQTLCAGRCVLLGADAANCGQCGNTCLPSQLCSGGACVDRVSISATGCADGTREHFADEGSFPNIAACRGGWDGNGGTLGYTGVFPSPLRTANAGCDQAGNDGSNPNGTGCSAVDLCAPGWHLCAGGEVGSRTGDQGCFGDTWPANSFYAAAIGSTGCYVCALTTGSVTGAACTNASCASGCQANPGLTNDIFGCGDALSASSVVCDVNMTGNDLCGALVARGGWSCGTDDVRESVNAAFDPTATINPNVEGGVLCCRDQ